MPTNSHKALALTAIQFHVATNSITDIATTYTFVGLDYVATVTPLIRLELMAQH